MSDHGTDVETPASDDLGYAAVPDGLAPPVWLPGSLVEGDDERKKKLTVYMQAHIVERFALGDSARKIIGDWPSTWPKIARSSIDYYRRRYRVEIKQRQAELALDVPNWGVAAKPSAVIALLRLNDKIDEVIERRGLVWKELVKSGRAVEEQDVFADKLVKSKLDVVDQISRLMGHYPSRHDAGARVAQSVVVNIPTPVGAVDMPRVEVIEARATLIDTPPAQDEGD